MTLPNDDDRRPLEEWEEPELDWIQRPSAFRVPVDHPTEASQPAKSTRPPLTITDDPVFKIDDPAKYADAKRQTHAVVVAEPVAPPKPQGPLVFDERQEAAIDACSTDLYTNISGTAGVGKTLVAREIVKRHPGVVLAATTGIASVNLGEGTTINSLLKYFDTESLQDDFEHGKLQAQVRRLRRSGIRRILIDEKSMMQAKQLTLITRAIREVNEGGIYALEDVGAGDIDEESSGAARDRDLPPIGITLVGDFGQLAPVPDKNPETGRNLPIEYAFDSKEWKPYGEHTTTLTKIYRQDAQDFIAALHAVRKGDVQGAVNFFTAPTFARAINEDFQGTTIFAKNKVVDRHNQLQLDKLPGAPMVAATARTGKQRSEWVKDIKDPLRLKEGALIMILANLREYEDEHDSLGTLVYANGDLGILHEPMGEGWAVTLHRTGQEVTVYPVLRENTIPLEVGRRKEIRLAFAAGTGPDPTTVITDEGKGRQEIIGTITYMPMRAAYGCTVHKTQGLTLDNVQVNIRDWMFKQPGMLFVALSRARTAAGLRIVGDQRGFIDRCRVEPRVQPWL